MKQGLILLYLFILSGCASAPLLSVVTDDAVFNPSQSLEGVLVQQFEKLIQFSKTDGDVPGYLRDLARKLVSSNPELQSPALGISLIKNIDEKWRSFNMPGNRIYLPVALLKKLSFENEVAAIIALQLGHLSRGHVLERAKAQFISKANEPTVSPQTDLKRIEYFGPLGIFEYTEEEEKQAIQIAVGMLYRAGYDSRGIISVFNYYRNNDEYSPFGTDEIEKVIEQARREIALFASLRNPIVRSSSFLLMQKRIQRL